MTHESVGQNLNEEGWSVLGNSKANRGSCSVISRWHLAYHRAGEC